ncbi:type I-B CRISPR-associated protein Cas5b [Sporohalobacter salinus]|uniref:type I-B CRISPR-associated protein Cas5b n=1 Tax=Sporohalobacter salinus TaxID=1494606 RepID=UPI00195F7DB7|nr:type I-B CRISPR-associated protein Cas5b [Sporohalobacter salinus]MBM7623756.1 CRISPR-associated protein Cas5t [Sporohalobacter salinus]
MKVLKLKLFQETACYKKPFAFKVGETYPLPPYSTVKGMLHRVLDAEEFIPMKISIQGNYDSKFVDYQNMYFDKDDKTTKMPLNIHLLHNVELIIHVKAKEEVLNRIIKGIKNSNEYLSLGRREDLIRIDEIKFVDLDEYDPWEKGKNYFIKYPIYIPINKITEEIEGINYRLNWKYKIIDDLRQWEKIDVKYVEKGSELSDEIDITIDEDKDLVFFNL